MIRATCEQSVTGEVSKKEVHGEPGCQDNIKTDLKEKRGFRVDSAGSG
jgi:hypothetical protein